MEAADFSSAELARAEVTNVMRASGAKSDVQLQAVLKKKAKSILSLDPYMQVEICTFEALCGAGSERRLLTVVLGMFPDESTKKDASDVAQALSQLCKSEQYSYSCQSAQSKLQIVVKWTNRVIADQPPQMGVAADCPLLAEVSARFQFFLRCKVPAGGSAEAPETQELVGLQALEVLYDQVKTAAGKAPKERQAELLEVCAPLVVFK